MIACDDDTGDISDRSCECQFSTIIIHPQVSICKWAVAVGGYSPERCFNTIYFLWFCNIIYVAGFQWQRCYICLIPSNSCCSYSRSLFFFSNKDKLNRRDTSKIEGRTIACQHYGRNTFFTCPYKLAAICASTIPCPTGSGYRKIRILISTFNDNAFQFAGSGSKSHCSAIFKRNRSIGSMIDIIYISTELAVMMIASSIVWDWGLAYPLLMYT